MTTGTFRQFPVFVEGELGYDADASIEPIVDGEGLNGATMSRAALNLRERTEYIRALFEDLLYLADADRGLIVAGPGKVTWPGSVTAGSTGIFTLSDVLYLLPALTAGSVQVAPVPSTGSTFGTVSLDRASDSTAAILVTSLLRNYQGGDKINITVVNGDALSPPEAFSCVLADETTMSIVITTTATTTLTAVINALNALVTSNGDNICNAALTGAAVGADIIETPQSVRRISGNHDAEAHAITPAQLAAFFGVAGNPLREGDTLCIQYSTMIDTSPLADGGRRQALPENSNTSVLAASLFNSRVNPERLVNAIPVCKVVNGRLCFISGQQVPAASTDYDLGLGPVPYAITDFVSSVIYNDGGARFGQGAHAGLVFAVNAGTYWMSGQKTNKAADTTTLANNTTSYVYIDTDGDLKNTAVLATAVALPKLVLYKVATAGGAITTVTDLRRYHTRFNSRAFVTVNGSNGDFDSIEKAVAWFDAMRAAGETSPLKIVVQGDVTIAAQISLPTGLTICASDGADVAVTTPGGTSAFTVQSGNVENVAFENLVFNIPTTAGSAFLSVGGDAVVNDWRFTNCQFIGGRDAHLIKVASSEAQANWRIVDCSFSGMAHTSAYYAIALEQMTGAIIDRNTFTGGTGDGFDCFAGIYYTSTKNVISRNRVSTGGVAVLVTDGDIAVSTSGATTDTTVRGNHIASSVGIAYSDPSTGPSHFEDNHVRDCNVSGAATSGVATISGLGTKVFRHNAFYDWVNGAAIASSGGAPELVVDSNVFSTDEAAPLYAVYVGGAGSAPVVCDNVVDLSRGAGSGAGKSNGIAFRLSTIANASVTGNAIRNVGSAGTPSTGVITVSSTGTVASNTFKNCRGTMVSAPTSTSIVGNVDDQVTNGARVEGDLTVAGDVYHTTEHEEYIHAATFQFTFQNTNVATLYDFPPYRYNFGAGVGSAYAPLPFLKVGDHITYAQIWYDPEASGAGMTPSLYRVDLATGTSTAVWTGVNDATGSAIESQNSGVIDHEVLTGCAYYLDITHNHANNRTHGGMVKFKRPHP